MKSTSLMRLIRCSDDEERTYLRHVLFLFRELMETFFVSFFPRKHDVKVYCTWNSCFVNV